MEDKKLMKLLGEEIKKKTIIYDKKIEIPKYSIRNRLIKTAYAEIANDIKNTECSYFWLKGGEVENLYKKIRNKYCIISRKDFKSLKDQKFLDIFSFFKNVVEIRSAKKLI
ncbi:uncharacterized protein LOC127287975 [Leptopilina boulardi]|uniref:uncharacterized protein LOC127287975 n=1 Tax=Leptopilina boulardi TaxID=63433 RepID=UPI0021F51A7D|nr:uncharacterized protein LOC127287975 [Leptopilina boulardi]